MLDFWSCCFQLALARVTKMCFMSKQNPQVALGKCKYVWNIVSLAIFYIYINKMYRASVEVK